MKPTTVMISAMLSAMVKIAVAVAILSFDPIGYERLFWSVVVATSCIFEMNVLDYVNKHQG